MFLQWKYMVFRMKRKEYITEKDLGYIELENVRSSYSEGKKYVNAYVTHMRQNLACQ